jgi:hypothetical protein
MEFQRLTLCTMTAVEMEMGKGIDECRCASTVILGRWTLWAWLR